MSSLVVGVAATDLWVIGLVALLFTLVAAIAAAFPIMHAVHIEPTEALRFD